MKSLDQGIEFKKSSKDIPALAIRPRKVPRAT